MEEYLKLSPRIRAQAYRSEHRIFQSGYYTSVDIDSETILEIYLPLSVFKIERIREEESEEKTKTDLEKYVEELYEVEQEED